jgi:hypothetical protein
MTGRQDQPATRSSDGGPSPLDSALPGQASEKRAASNPVLGSIVEQFGKLRRQRAMDRQINKKAR